MTIDNTAPVINLGVVPLVIITNSYLLSVNIVEGGSTNTYIKINGDIIGPFTQKEFSYLIEFEADGTKVIEITSTDAAGNSHIKNIEITRNTGPLIGQILSPLPNTSVNSRIVSFIVSANKPIAQLKINGVIYPYTGQKLTEIAWAAFNLIRRKYYFFRYELFNKKELPMNEKNKTDDEILDNTAADGAVCIVKQKRKRSGPIPGGRAVDRVVRYKERRGGRAFTLRVHFDFDSSTAMDKERLITQLKSILKKLEL